MSSFPFLYPNLIAAPYLISFWCIKQCLELAQDADDLLYPWFQLDINGSPSFVYSMPLNWHILIRVPGAESNNTIIFLIILLGIRYIIANNIITKEWPTLQFVINFL